ncbi:hypothetical protein BT96DRAFT_560617 [Gymnopus androsaceus JB14]|uniref:F-box domain-containing protein n=1 Tax=Gymnopus androsaceus JB14 TaxID=1447944 RepID=A0A6A4GJY5_9AGAR|nr:hypothetical protein BT96DRAFT_560617 [Gymnopus androsaceus JB14]
MRRSLRLRDKITDNSEMSPSADNADLSTDDCKHRRSKEEEEDESRRAKKKAGKGYSGQGDEYAVKGINKMLQGSKKIQGEKGLLEKLAKDAPLEIFFEIFMHLEPGDLLQLARTSKDLRNVLMSKSSETDLYMQAYAGFQAVIYVQCVRETPGFGCRNGN